MLQFNIINTIDKLEVINSDGSLFFYIKIKHSFFGAGKRTLFFYDNGNKIFFVLEKYSYVLFFKKKVLVNKLNSEHVFYRNKLSCDLSFDDKIIKFIYLDNFGKRIKINLNNVAFGIVTRTFISTEKVEYIVDFEKPSLDNFPCLISLCSNLDFSW